MSDVERKLELEWSRLNEEERQIEGFLQRYNHFQSILSAANSADRGAAKAQRRRKSNPTRDHA